VCGRSAGGGAGGGGGGTRDTESKTRTPHKVVGKNQPFEDAQKLLPGHEGGLGSEWAGSLGEGL